MKVGIAVPGIVLLPAVLAGAWSILSGIDPVYLLFILLYAVSVLFSFRMGSDGWIAIIVGGEPLVVASGANNIAVFIQVTVIWAAMLSAWVGGEMRSTLAWAGTVGIGILIIGWGILIVNTLIASLVIIAVLCLGAASIVWYGDSRMRKRIGVR
ncbi:hypothetical protein [Methanofollis fontis]|uniref:Uncharacterized protein n=1 Tax=Methanofollis fontis TaxID=2052832 RepID=A0A483CS14_9EURY|nr:hypothetical protein [Methanofollis fontis]TAJ43930.1 hypothetical protein CUJ86_07690 [Methanofollis fontis]